MRSTHIIVLFNGSRVIKKCLVYLTEVLAYVTLHFKRFDLTIILSYEGVTKLITFLRVAQFIFYLGQNQ